MSAVLPWLPAQPVDFPAPEQALNSPNGLLAMGGGLSVEWLLCAYRRGIFPWYQTGQPILWWSPHPRQVLRPEALRVSRSLRKFIRKRVCTITFNQDFAAVIRRCAAPRRGDHATWLTLPMQHAYCRLHRAGFAHSVEVWNDGRLVGGLYGVALGRIFFGESMFADLANSSKLALVHLVRHLQLWGFELIDCQVSSEHLGRLGAENISRGEFQTRLKELIARKADSANWLFDPALDPCP